MLSNNLEGWGTDCTQIHGVSTLSRCFFSVGFATLADSFRNNCSTKEILCTLFISFQVEKHKAEDKDVQHSKFIFFLHFEAMEVNRR